MPDGTEGKLVKCPGCGHAQRVPQESAEEPPQPAAASEPVRARKSSTPTPAKTKQSKRSAELPDESAANSELHEDVDDSSSDHAGDIPPQAIEEPIEEDEADVPSGASVSPDVPDDLDDREEDDADASVETPLDDESVEEAWQEEADQEDEDQNEESADVSIDDDVESFGNETVAEAWSVDDEVDGQEEAVVEHYPVATPVAHPRATSASGHREYARNVATKGGAALLIVGWMLRVLAVMSVAGVVKILLLMGDAGAGVVDVLFVAPFLLGLVATFWAVGELSLAARERHRE